MAAPRTVAITAAVRNGPPVLTARVRIPPAMLAILPKGA